jgi:iron complex transport system substrate-binding protein
LSSELIGHPELAEPRIDAYCKIVADLQQELRPSSLTYRPRVQMVGEPKGTVPRAGMVDVEAEREIPGDDAERLLILDPDMIFLVVGSPQEFERDSSWQALKAVQKHQVYRRPGQLEWWATGVTFKPVLLRWLAEIAHPERLQPNVRQLLRDRVMSEFGYRLSEEQIDLVLHVKENAGSVGAERFTRGYQTTSEQRSSK